VLLVLLVFQQHQEKWLQYGWKMVIICACLTRQTFVILYEVEKKTERKGCKERFKLPSKGFDLHPYYEIQMGFGSLFGTL
jgi:hypothetical protein